jgi:hypothetical protein
MAEPDQGKSVFQSVVEYPLPKKAGIRDYLFYFVRPTDGYGRGARSFFNKFYPNHVRREATTLEGLINTLHGDIAAGGFEQIRELVIVSHGSAVGLLFAIFDGVTKTNLPEFKYHTGFALALLQKDIREGRFQPFDAKRKQVIARFTDESWITIRACNFGQSFDGMFATYAFFGGRANVYCPTEYQFFGSHPIVKGMRLETRLRVHDHLVRQHFLPRDVHSPARQDAEVKALVDPARFSEPFTLASMRVVDPAPDEQATYEGIIDALNGSRTNAAVKAQFEAQGFALSGATTVEVVSPRPPSTPNISWLIRDVLTHEEGRYRIRYHVFEALDNSGPRQMVKLSVEAKLVGAHSANEAIPIQLFFYPYENENWRGKLFTLAAYALETVPDAPSKARVDAIIALLNRGTPSDASSGIDIRAEFKTRGNIDLSAQPKIRRESTGGSQELPEITWSIEGGGKYLIKLEHPPTSDGVLTNSLTIYRFTTKLTRLQREYHLMARQGSDPDTPGTELAACLDRSSLDDLAAMIDYLRSPLKPGHAFYVHQAQQALQRKKDFVTWLKQREPDTDKMVLPSPDSYTTLSLGESEERSASAYAFEFNRFWREIKQSSPPSKPVQEDLFAEVDLVKRLRISAESVTARRPLGDLPSDSPYTDIEELRALERQGRERLFVVEKVVADLPDESTVAASDSCEEFAAAVRKWKELRHLEPAELKKALEGFKTSKGRSFLDVLGKVADHYEFVKDMAKLAQLMELPAIPTAKELAKFVVHRVPFLSRILLLRVLFEIDVVTIPIQLWLQVLEDQQNVVKNWENKGKLTAMRQWLRILNDLTFFKENDFPDEPEIDVFAPLSSLPYHIGRFYAEQAAQTGSFALSQIDDVDAKALKAGFDAGGVAMPRVWEEIRRHTEDGIFEVLNQSGLTSCQVRTLDAEGVLDLRKLKALVIRELSQALLDELPTFRMLPR